MPHANTIDELSRLLRQKMGFIAHCAGFAKGVGSVSTSQLSFLGRLRYAIDNTDIELSCSTVVPGDSFDLQRMNYTGNIGIVLRPNESTSIAFACPTDAGSQIDPDDPKRRVTGLRRPATIQDVRSAILDRPADRYNELGILSYTVLGVFIDGPVQYSFPGGVETVDYREIASAFSDQRFFYLHNGTLLHMEWTKGAPSVGSAVDLHSLY